MNARMLGRFVSSMVALLAIVVAVPVGLVAASTARFGSANPLAGARPPWAWGSSEIGDAVSGPLAEATVIDGIVRASLCILWLSVAVIAVTTIGEFVHALRHRGLPLPDRHGLGWAQRVARFIVVGMVAALPLGTPPTSLASTMEARPVAASTPSTAGSISGTDGTSGVMSQPPEQAALATSSSARAAGATLHTTHGVTTSPLAPTAVSAATHVVGTGESIYSIAVDLAGGDAARVIGIADAIIDANLGSPMPSGQRFTTPAYIEPGWIVTIPAAIVGTSPSATSRGPMVQVPHPGQHLGDPVTDIRADMRTDVGVRPYVVEPGDTLWDIAGEQLGDPTAWPEIWEENAGDEMVDGRTFDDPNLIIPGWELELADGDAALPSSGEETPPPTDTPSTTPDAPPPQPQPAPEPEPTPTTALGDTADADTVTPLPTTSTAGPSDAASRAPSTSMAPIDDSGTGANGPGVAAAAPEAPSPIRLEHAALLAAGVLALVGVRRRQRLRAAMPHHRVPEPHPDIADTERRLRTVGAGERALRVDVACRAAAWSLIDAGSQIGWVIASTDGTIELRLTGPATLPPPWVGSGQTWRLAAETPIELLSEDARQVGQPCVALVQLGLTPDGDEVIVDLEAAGELAISAHADQADQVVTAVAASLASSVFAEVAHLVGVSVPPSALLGHRNAHLTESSDAAIELAMTLTGTTTSNERTSFELRSLRTGGEVWEPAVVLLQSTDAHDIDDAVGTVVAGHGVAVVVADEHRRFDHAGARLSGTPDGWQLEAFGAEIDLTPIGVTGDDLTAIADLLADAGRALEPVDQDDPGGRTGEPSEHPTDERDAAAAFVSRPHAIVVGLLGAVNVRDRNGQLGSFERSKTVELIAWLATHRDRATRSGARTALWEMDVRDATFANVVSEARRKLARLVTPPDGEEWVGRTLTEQLPLHDLVVSDADLVEERLAHARVQPPSQAIETLRPAVELIRELPFAGTGYLWPDAEGLTSNLVMLAITATSEYAAHALSLGDTDGVFWATGQGLKVLSGHEELIALRMRAHAHSGDLAGVRQEWEAYERVLVADAWSDGEPAPQLLALRRELLDPTVR